jgi:rifampin ADP-ribosylating transferase
MPVTVVRPGPGSKPRMGEIHTVHRPTCAYAVAVGDVLDEGPFFHGTKADLRAGDLLTAGFRSNYRPDVVMNHIYFTALRDGAGLAAELAAGAGAPRVYLVEPTGSFENDPNVTDKKFPGNPTRSYRSREPLRVIGEVTDWTRLTPEALRAWRDRLAALRDDERGEIIN